MPKQKTDRAIVAEIREVIKDMNAHFKVRNYKQGGHDDLGNNMGESLVLELIEDALNGKAGSLTRDYRRTKADAAKAARAAANPAP